jgi:hypothetical protein
MLLEWSHHEMEWIRVGEYRTEAVEHIDPESIVDMMCFPDKERKLEESYECTEGTHDS